MKSHCNLPCERTAQKQDTIMNILEHSLECIVVSLQNCQKEPNCKGLASKTFTITIYPKTFATQGTIEQSLSTIFQRAKFYSSYLQTIWLYFNKFIKRDFAEILQSLEIMLVGSFVLFDKIKIYNKEIPAYSVISWGQSLRCQRFYKKMKQNYTNSYLNETSTIKSLTQYLSHKTTMYSYRYS